VTVKDSHSAETNIETLTPGIVNVIVNDGITLINSKSVSTQEILGVEIFDLVAVDDASISFNQAGLNSITLSGSEDVTIVTGDLTIDATTFADTTQAITTADGNITTSIDITADTFLLAGSYDSNTGLFITTADGAGSDTLIYEGASANALSANSSAVILVGVDSDELVAPAIIG